MANWSKNSLVSEERPVIRMGGAYYGNVFLDRLYRIQPRLVSLASSFLLPESCLEHGVAGEGGWGVELGGREEGDGTEGRREEGRREVEEEEESRLPPAQQPFHKIISGFSRQFSPATKKKKVCELAAL